MGLVPTVPAVLAGAFLLGLNLSTFTVLWQSALQQHVPNDMLGRVTSIDSFGAVLLGPLTPIVIGGLVVVVGPVPVFVAGGLIVAAAALAGLLIPSIRQLE
jgi:MFS family permease